MIPNMKHLCPKADRCIVDCFHRTPHVYNAYYCNPDYHSDSCKENKENDECGVCNIKCVPELIADVIIFEEDFKV